MGVVQELEFLIKDAARRKIEQDAQQVGQKVGQAVERGAGPGFERMIGWAKRLAGALGLALGISAIVRFGQASIRAANESEKAWNDLNITLRNNKIRLQDVRGEVEKLGQRALRKTAFGDEAAIQSLNRLVQITGDYKLALRAVPAAMDLAVAKSIGLDEASKLVGRALIGNTTALKRQGVELDATKDIVDQLIAKFGGAAEGELKTFGGRVRQLGQWFGELKEAIGDVLVAAGSGGSALETLTGSLQGMTTWVKANKKELGELATVISKTVTAAIREMANGIRDLRNLLPNTLRELKALAGRGAWIGEAQRQGGRAGVDPASLSAGAGHGGGRRLRTDALGARAGGMMSDVVGEITAVGVLNQRIIAQGAEAVALAIKTAGELTKGVQADILAQWEAENTIRLGHIRFRADAEDQAIQQMNQAMVDWNSKLAEWDQQDRQRKKAAQIEYLAHLEEQAFRLEQIIDNTLAIADAWGLVSEELGRVLSSLSRAATDAASFAKSLASGDVLGAIGSGINLIGDIGGAIGIKGSKDPERFATNQVMYERAIQGDEAALEFLRVHSVVSQNGSAGWGSGPAAADAAVKYAAAKRIVDELQAPGQAAAAEEERVRAEEEATRAADQAERERLDQIREEEERQVAGREQEEELAGEAALQRRAEPLGEAIMAQVAAAIAEARAADKIAEGSELGEDSPLARDARRRANEAIREAERAVEEAEREKERIAGDKVTPGFTVQRTITESSAGRVIGELVTSNHWLEKIYHQLGGAGGITAPAVAAPPAVVPVIENHLYVDGRELTEVVSTRMYQNFQNVAARNGNAGMGG